MNWDWEKLQEKRRRQKNPSQNRGEDSNDANTRKQRGEGLDKAPQTFTAPPFRFVLIFAAALFLLWAGSGFFILDPGVEGVILRFGEYNRTVHVGPHYHLPYPIEEVYRVNTGMLRFVEVGEMDRSSSGKGTVLKQAPREKWEEGTVYRANNLSGARSKNILPPRNFLSAMFTGDENIIHVNFTVQYSIANAEKYLFSVKNPTAVIEHAAESAMREVVARNKVELILTQGREGIQSEALAILSSLLASYDMGVKVHAVQLGDVYPPAEVEQAFIDVASAREAKITIENEAEAYRAKIVPVATGTASSIVNAAKAYEQWVVKKAEGEAYAFQLLLKEFEAAPAVGKKRMYLDVMEDVLSSESVEKFIISGKVKNLIPLFPFGGEGISSHKPSILEGEASQTAGVLPSARGDDLLGRSSQLPPK